MSSCLQQSRWPCAAPCFPLYVYFLDSPWDHPMAQSKGPGKWVSRDPITPLSGFPALSPALSLFPLCLVLAYCFAEPGPSPSLRCPGWGSHRARAVILPTDDRREASAGRSVWLILATDGLPARATKGSSILGLLHTGFRMRWYLVFSPCVFQMRGQSPAWSQSCQMLLPP